MTLKLPVDEVYVTMLEEVETRTDGDAKEDLARAVESIIHENYQEVCAEQS